MAVLRSSLVQINSLNLNNSSCFIPFDFEIIENYQKCEKEENTFLVFIETCKLFLRRLRSWVMKPS